MSPKEQVTAAGELKRLLNTLELVKSHCYIASHADTQGADVPSAQLAERLRPHLSKIEALAHSALILIGAADEAVADARKSLGVFAPARSGQCSRGAQVLSESIVEGLRARGYQTVLESVERLPDGTILATGSSAPLNGQG